MISSGFTNAPISKYGMVFIIASSIVVSIADVKYLLYIQVVPHLWKYWQLSYTNSTEVLFGALLIYQLRVIERLWGSRKFGSFLISTLPYTALLPPLILSFLLRPLSLNTLNFLPAGPTAILFALLVQFYSAIPPAYKYRIAAPTTTAFASSPTATTPSISVSDKSTTYLLGAQLALSQFPHSLVPAAVGWAVGYAWRSDILPGRAAAWRVPGWVYGNTSVDAAAREHRRAPEGLRLELAAGGGGPGCGRWWGGRGGDAERFEGMRRRLERESRAAAAAGGVGVSQVGLDRQGPNEGGDGGRGRGQQRRPLAGQILDRFTGSY
ncbi:predicted protein [Histoplasma mississippiense (nom. inval.)]|uniref:predicted protein n=1 Tax=Ajellomyces capsulatus (strain NAm1 / WU24) TaxID=2059318 RepID=UPI000157B766|nr:predicted protein [Histoplasma mississippiense (nom. inval.)]EDN03668.1 predicted protein [Histoplasma mississippiense (nom. inval.)]